MQTTTLIRNNCFNRFTAITIILAFCLSLASTGISQTTDQEKLEEAIQYYETGYFDKAIDLLSKCISRAQLDKERMTMAYKYLAQAYMAKDYLKQAKDAVEHLLEMVPQYSPDPVQDRPQFVELVRDVKKELGIIEETEDELAAQADIKPAEAVDVEGEFPTIEKKGSSTKWILIGGGAVALGIVAVVVLSGNGDENGGTTTTTGSIIVTAPNTF